MAAFDLVTPSAGELSVLVEVPHAGLAVPDDVQAVLAAPLDALMRDADLYVDKLYANAPQRGARLLVSNVSRYVVDLNRDRGDVDRGTVSDHPAPVGAQPRGVVWRATTDGRPVLRRPLDYRGLLARLARYYEPYHATLGGTLADLRDRHGFAILLAAHSMPSTGRTLHADPGSERADVVPGTRGRTSCDPRLIDLVDAHFRTAGLSVLHDTPYRGGFSTVHYGRPAEGLHAIQIELNRALYMDERNFEPRENDFRALVALLDSLIDAIGKLDLRAGTL
jgi:N-formylglutamate amidohydrolase